MRRCRLRRMSAASVVAIDNGQRPLAMHQLARVLAGLTDALADMYVSMRMRVWARRTPGNVLASGHAVRRAPLPEDGRHGTAPRARACRVCRSGGPPARYLSRVIHTETDHA